MTKLENLKKLKVHVNMDADQVVDAHNVISRAVKWAPELTILCTPSYSLSIRRFLMIPEHTWKEQDRRVIQAAIAEIERLKGMEPSYATALALSCLGVRKETLPLALRSLQEKVELAKLDAGAVRKADSREDVEETPTRVVERKGEPPVEPLHSLKELDTSTLDPDTAAQLKAMQESVAAEQGISGE